MRFALLCVGLLSALAFTPPGALPTHVASSVSFRGTTTTMFSGAKSSIPKKSAKVVKKAAPKKAVKKVVKKAVMKAVKKAATVEPNFFASLFGAKTPTTPTNKKVKKPVKGVKKTITKAGPSQAQKAAKQEAENRKIVEQRRVAQKARMFKAAKLREGQERKRLAIIEKQRKEKEVAQKMAARKVLAAAKVEAIAREKARASGKLYTAKVPRLSSQPKIG